MKLDLNDYPNITELQPGETTNLCHVDCPAGDDTRYRLFFTRPTGRRNALLVYCHNCQDGTIVEIEDQYRLPELDEKAKSGNPVDKFEIPIGLHNDHTHWPPAARAWAYKNFGHRNTEALAWDPSTNRVYLPIYEVMYFANNEYMHSEGDLQAYQLRLVEGKGPKYLTVKRNKEYIPFTWMVPEDYDAIVIVEDFASGWALMRETNNTMVCVNYGVQVKLEQLHEVAKKDKPCLVWFDNDNPHVIEQAEKVQRTLLTLGCPKARVAQTMSLDPKNAMRQEIEEQLDWIR